MKKFISNVLLIFLFKSSFGVGFSIQAFQDSLPDGHITINLLVKIRGDTIRPIKERLHFTLIDKKFQNYSLDSTIKIKDIFDKYYSLLLDIEKGKNDDYEKYQYEAICYMYAITRIPPSSLNGMLYSDFSSFNKADLIKWENWYNQFIEDD